MGPAAVPAGPDRRRPAPTRRPTAGHTALTWAGLAVLGLLATLRVVVSGRTAPIVAGEQQLVDDAAAALAGAAVGPLTGWLGEFAARAQLTGYAALTSAFERYPAPATAARELAAVAALITVAALVALGWRLRLRPAAVGVGLGLLAAVDLAGVALGSFGPGQLGVMWLAVGGALLVRAGRGPRVLGGLAVLTAALTVPALAVALTAAVLVAALARRLSEPATSGLRALLAAAIAAGLAGTAVVLLGRLPQPLPITALDPSGQQWLIAAAAVAVLTGIVLRDRRQQALAVGAAVLLILVGWRFPGADALLPALAVAVAVLAAVLVDQLAGQLTGRRLCWRTGRGYADPATVRMTL